MNFLPNIHPNFFVKKAIFSITFAIGVTSANKKTIKGKSKIKFKVLISDKRQEQLTKTNKKMWRMETIVISAKIKK